MLESDEFIRYQRQIVLDEIGYEGQKQLKSASVLCVGAGGLGSSLCLYLVAAGVGTLGIIDEDKVSLNNLHRQILYRSSECGLQKTEQAKLHLEKINPHCKVEIYNQSLAESNALELIRRYDIIVDCSDNFRTRYLINDVCRELNKPNVFACVQKFKGYCTVFHPNGPCYRCLFAMPPENYIPNCANSGVLGTVPGILGTLQANEVLKLILDIGKPLIGRVFVFDALMAKVNFIQLSPACESC